MKKVILAVFTLTFTFGVVAAEYGEKLGANGICPKLEASLKRAASTKVIQKPMGQKEEKKSKGV